VKVFFHRAPGGNVGDDLNADLWRRLIPELDELATADWLIGIGTILDERINALPGRKIVMGSGVRPNGAGRLHGDIRIAAVRGLLSAQRLGLDRTLAVCDPGFLVARLWPGANECRDRIGLIPHVYSMQWTQIAQAGADAGLEVISPTLAIDDFLQRLRRCERVFCESLHGAIFADALRIPWARVRLSSHYFEGAGVSDFKWQDAFSVVGVAHSPINKLALLRPKRAAGLVRSLMRPAQSLAETRIARALKKRSDDASLFGLSDEARLQEQTQELLARIERLRSQHELQQWPVANA
jgi:succinoglycan biosynthesis protein ExoV